MRALKKQLYNQFILQEQKSHNLHYLFWECTQRCNLSCLHCGSDCVSSSHYPDMPADDFLKVLDLINKQPHEKIIVNITGGEPLLRNDLEKCGYEIRRRGFRWGIVTNGLAYTKERHNSLMNAGMGAVTLSLDGMEENHNWLRNHAESFNKALNAIPLLTTEKRLNFDVVTCINKKNLSELEELYQFLLINGVKSWRLFTIAPIGRAKNYDIMLLDGIELNTMMEFIESKRKLNEMDIRFSCEAYVGKREEQVRDGFFFCRAGIHIGSVLIDGSISGCPNIDRRFAQGNIYNNSFNDIWNHGFTEYRNRNWMKNAHCGSCKEFKYCHGGAFHLRNFETKENIYCHYTKMKFS